MHEESSQVNGHEGSGRATPTLKNTELFRATAGYIKIIIYEMKSYKVAQNGTAILRNFRSFLLDT